MEKFRLTHYPKNMFRILGYLLIAFVLASTFWFGSKRYKYLQKEREAKTFIEQIIKSARDDTDFYKLSTENDIIMKVAASRNVLSHSYVISTIDFSWDIYEGAILFDNGTCVKVDVSFLNNEPYILHNWNQIKQ